MFTKWTLYPVELIKLPSSEGEWVSLIQGLLGHLWNLEPIMVYTNDSHPCVNRSTEGVCLHYGKNRIDSWMACVPNIGRKTQNVVVLIVLDEKESSVKVPSK